MHDLLPSSSNKTSARKTTMAPSERPRILVINPNSTAAITKSLEDMFATQPGFDDCDLDFTQPPSGPPSINNDDDGEESLPHCIAHLAGYPPFATSDAFLVACYSDHPLVGWLRSEESVARAGKPVLGIFEASVIRSMELLGAGQKFGIVSTGKVWEKLLEDALRRLDRDNSGSGGDGDGDEAREAYWPRFAGVETTGLSAIELHDTPQEEVTRRMKDATRRLVARAEIGAVCLGCAGMVGMDSTVREALKEELGDVGDKVAIVDGVLAGVKLLLEQCVEGEG